MSIKIRDTWPVLWKQNLKSWFPFSYTAKSSANSISTVTFPPPSLLNIRLSCNIALNWWDKRWKRLRHETGGGRSDSARWQAVGVPAHTPSDHAAQVGISWRK